MCLLLPLNNGISLPSPDLCNSAEFNSNNNAIQAENDRERESNINFISALVGILDAMQNNPKLASSPTLMSSLLSDSLKMPVETVNRIYKEFQTQKAEQEPLMKSMPTAINHNDLSQKELAALVKELLSSWRAQGIL
ncbi:hypothetical protein EGK14_21265 [Erwinia sp. 198]|nr:hypothetical protein EGK14_21265 [Erwinia sp. 198]